jgi:hypothetical protein
MPLRSIKAVVLMKSRVKNKMRASRFGIGRHINSFNRSGMGLDVIVNLSRNAIDSRPVNSGVRLLSVG